MRLYPVVRSFAIALYSRFVAPLCGPEKTLIHQSSEKRERQLRGVFVGRWVTGEKRSAARATKSQARIKRERAVCLLGPGVTADL